MTQTELAALRRVCSFQPIGSFVVEPFDATWVLEIVGSRTIIFCDATSQAKARRTTNHWLPYLGIFYDADHVPIQLAISVDMHKRIAELEVVRMDGGPMLDEIDPKKIISIASKAGSSF